MYISVWVCAHECDTFKGQRGHQIPWTWSEQMTGSHFTLLLGVKLRSCARAARTLNHRTISAGPGFCSEADTSPGWPNAQSSCLIVMNSGMIGICHHAACPLTLCSCLCHELRPLALDAVCILMYSISAQRLWFLFFWILWLPRVPSAFPGLAFHFTACSL